MRDELASSAIVTHVGDNHIPEALNEVKRQELNHSFDALAVAKETIDLDRDIQDDVANVLDSRIGRSEHLVMLHVERRIDWNSDGLVEYSRRRLSQVLASQGKIDQRFWRRFELESSVTWCGCVRTTGVNILLTKLIMEDFNSGMMLMRRDSDPARRCLIAWLSSSISHNLFVDRVMGPSSSTLRLVGTVTVIGASTTSVGVRTTTKWPLWLRNMSSIGSGFPAMTDIVQDIRRMDSVELRGVRCGTSGRDGGKKGFGKE